MRFFVHLRRTQTRNDAVGLPLRLRRIAMTDCFRETFLFYFIKQFKITLSGHTRRCHICPDMGNRNFLRATFDYYRTFYALFNHYDVIAFLVSDGKTFEFENFYKDSIMNRYNFLIGHQLCRDGHLLSHYRFSWFPY